MRDLPAEVGPAGDATPPRSLLLPSQGVAHLHARFGRKTWGWVDMPSVGPSVMRQRPLGPGLTLQVAPPRLSKVSDGEQRRTAVGGMIKPVYFSPHKRQNGHATAPARLARDRFACIS